jgi:hypothetical protein
MTPSPLSQRQQEESVWRFFQNLGSRAWTEAEKELDSIRQNSENTPWSKGYVKALEGLLLTFRSNDDKYIFLPKMLANGSEETIKSLRKEYNEFASNELHGDYDRGFFKALEEYLSKLTVQKPILETREVVEKTVEEKVTVTDSMTAQTIGDRSE